MVATLFAALLAAGTFFGPAHVALTGTESSQLIDAPDAVDLLTKWSGVRTPPANPTAGIAWATEMRKGRTVEIRGRITRTTNSGVQPVARLRVFVVPVNDYTAWLAMHALYYAKRGDNVPYSKKFDDGLYLHFVYTSYDGKFIFPNLNPGKYYLFSSAIVTYGKAVPGKAVLNGYTPQGDITKVDIPKLDMSDANVEIYTYLETFELVGQGVVDVGDIGELKRWKEYQPGEDSNLHPGDDELRQNTFFYLPAGETPTAAQLKPYLASGTGSITGRLAAFFKGTTEMKTYQGYNVFLIPDVQWAHAFSYSVGGQALQNGQVILPFPSWTKGVIRFARSDANGNFRFDDVAPGRYVLATYIDAVFNGSYSYTTGSSYLQYGITGYKYESGPYTTNDVTPEYGYTPVDTRQTVQVDTTCYVYGALGSLIDVSPGKTTPAGLAILGSSHEGGGCTGD